MPDLRSLTDRLVLIACRVGFWFPLLVCTYLALVPEPPDNPVFRTSDVILHAAAFTYLTFALVLTGTTRTVSGQDVPFNRGIAIKAFLVMLGYGVLLELVQSFIPERSAELKDLAVDGLGIAAGLLLASALARPVASLLHLLIGRLTGLR